MTSSNHRLFKDAVYEEFAQIGKALGNRKRFELLDLLSQGPRTVEVLSREAGLSVANTSHHLQGLKEARLVATAKDGLYVTYSLAAGVEALLAGIRGAAEQHRAEVGRLYREHFPHSEADAYDRDTLLHKIKNDQVVMLDVRPAEEYQAGHVAGAISMPLKALEKRLRDLPKNKEIAAYCRGRYCVFAVQAVEKLRARGFAAMRVEESVAELKKRGVRIVKGDPA